MDYLYLVPSVKDSFSFDSMEISKYIGAIFNLGATPQCKMSDKGLTVDQGKDLAVKKDR